MGGPVGWQNKSATKCIPAQLEDMSETETPPEVVDSIGGPTRIRTWNQQIMSLLNLRF